MLLIATTAMVFVPKEINVKADPGGGGEGENDYYLNFGYMWNVTTELANVIHNTSIYPPGSIKKGRSFGSAGDLWVSKYLLKEFQDNCSFSNAKKVRLKNIPGKYLFTDYSEFVKVTSYNLWINISGFPFNNNPLQEDYFPEVAVRTEFGGTLNNYTMNRPYDNIRVINEDDYNENYKNWMTGIDPLNITYTDLNNYNIVMGNLTYVAPEDNIAEYDYFETVFMFDEVEGVEAKIENALNASGIILIDSNTIGYTFQNASNYEFSIVTIQEYGDDAQNLTNVTQYLQEGKRVIVDSTIFDSKLTFVHDMNSSLCGPDFQHVILYNLTNQTKGIIDIVKNVSKVKLRNILPDRRCLGFIMYSTTTDNCHITYAQNIKSPRVGKQYPLFALPGFSVNKTVGEFLWTRSHDDPENTKISGYINQIHHKEGTDEGSYGVEAYNVEAYLNIPNSPEDAIVCISSRMDAMWNECPGDSGAGNGIIMGIAEYMSRLNQSGVPPKYNITFLMTTNEENGMYGAQFFSDSHPDDNIIMWIGTDQLGFKGGDTHLENVYKRHTHRNIGETIAERLDYEGKTGYGMEHNIAKIDLDKHYWYWPPLLKHGLGCGAEDVVFWERNDPNCDTILIHKGGDWLYHHARGRELTEGDVLDEEETYFDKNDASVFYNLTWDIVKYFCYDPDCWFENHSCELIDSDDNNFDDSVNFTFSINTSLPHDRVLVRAILQCEDFPFHNRLSRYSTEKNYIVAPDGVQDTLTVSLPKRAPKGDYSLHLYLYNSTGDIVLNAFEKDLDLILLNLLAEFLQEHFGIDISKLVELVEKYGAEILDKGFRFLVDLLDIRMNMPKFTNDTYEPGEFYMTPPSNPPAKPQIIDGPTEAERGKWYNFTATTTDPDGDQVYYQWDWRANALILHDYSPFLGYGPYDSGANHIQEHRWKLGGDKEVRVRAKDNRFNPNVWSEWSDPLEITLDNSCDFNALDKVIKDQNIEYTANIYSDVPVDNYTWTINSYSQYYYQQIINHAYTTPDNHTVTLNVTFNDSSTAEFSCNVEVVLIKADFNVSSVGAHPDENISFNDASGVYNHITNWTWNMGDGTIIYNPSCLNHSYKATGSYNVTLTVTDNESYNDTCSHIIYVDSVAPEPIAIAHAPEKVNSGENITIYTSFFDDQSGVDTVTVNITSPDNSRESYTMNISNSSVYDYEYVSSDTKLSGEYYYSIWVVDNANNTNSSTGYSFSVSPVFGNDEMGNNSQDVRDRITGSVFTVYEYGTADNITAYIIASSNYPPTYHKCMIYRSNDSALIGSTENISSGTGMGGAWMIYSFLDPKPILVKGTEYVLVCWSEASCSLYYNDFSDPRGRYDNEVYDDGEPPDPADFTNENRLYSIYCSYTPDTTSPEITNVSNDPDTIGFGFNVTITADVTDDLSGVDIVKVNITYPDTTTGNFTMDYIGEDTYEYVFSETWLVGQYNYTIWAIDYSSNINSSSGHKFNVLPINDDDDQEHSILPAIHNIEDFQLEAIIISIWELYIGQDVIKSVTDVIDPASEVIDEQYYRDVDEWKQSISIGPPIPITSKTINNIIVLGMISFAKSSINKGKHLALGPIFKGRMHTHALTNGNGNYHIYAVFGDDEGNVLKCTDDTYLVAKCDFTVTGV